MTALSVEYDVVIAGGGMAGSLAAVAAAESGARTLLIERHSCLGGMATLGLVQPITTWGIRGQYVVGGRGKRLLERLADGHSDAATEMSCYGPSCDAEFLKFELEKEVLGSGAEILYHCWIRDCVVGSNGAVERLVMTAKGGDLTVAGRVIVDATGDADVASSCGMPFELGDQGISLMVLLGGIDRDRCPERNEIGQLYAEERVGYRDLALFWHPRAGHAYLNVTEVEHHSALDPQDLTSATIECRRQAWDVMDVLRRRVPGFTDCYISQIAPALGVRESRRVCGDYRLTVEDATGGADFSDTIARASCPVDIHGSERSGKGKYYGIRQSYGIPYRCLKNSAIANLLVTGRPISADHAAHSSLRRMAPGSALGEAAGTAAAMASASGDVHAIDVPCLQANLLAHGAVLAPEPQSA